MDRRQAGTGELSSQPAEGSHPPICCMSDRKLPTPEWSVILPFCTRITSTDSKWIFRCVGATPRNGPSPALSGVVPGWGV
jgi:hypothetical protein